MKKNLYLLYSLLLPFFSIGNQCFASEPMSTKIKVEIRNDRKDLIVTSEGQLFAYNKVSQLGEVQQWSDFVNAESFKLTIGTINNPFALTLPFEVSVAGALARTFQPDPLFGIPLPLKPYMYMMYGKEYPSNTLAISTPRNKNVVLWGNSLMGTKAQSSDVFYLNLNVLNLNDGKNGGGKVTIIWEVVYELNGRKAKIYVQ